MSSRWELEESSEPWHSSRERRCHKRFVTDIPVVAEIHGTTYSDCRISNCSEGGIYLTFDASDSGEDVRVPTFDDPLDDEITVNVPMDAGVLFPAYAVPMSVVRRDAAGLGLSFCGSNLLRIVLSATP